jgi:exonuclease III
MRILTWNTGKNSTDLKKKAITDVILETKADILVFQECTGAYLTQIVPNTFYEIPYPSRSGIDKRVRIFLDKTKYQHKEIQPFSNNKLILVRVQDKIKKKDFNLVGIHLYSKKNNTEREQMWKNKPFFQHIEDFENGLPNCKDTIVVGDFNYNPYEKDHFDPNIINSLGSLKMLNFISSSTSFDRNKNSWYNPMWNLLGDYDSINKKRRINGTYYRYSNNENHPFWNMFDGFLIRLTLAPKINYNDFFIITKTKNINFIKPRVINEMESFIDERISDHLPVFMELNF